MGFCREKEVEGDLVNHVWWQFELCFCKIRALGVSDGCFAMPEKLLLLLGHLCLQMMIFFFFYLGWRSLAGSLLYSKVVAVVMDECFTHHKPWRVCRVRGEQMRGKKCSDNCWQVVLLLLRKDKPTKDKDRVKTVQWELKVKLRKNEDATGARWRTNSSITT